MKNNKIIDEHVWCPVCGKTEVEEYEFCNVCGWQHDPIQYIEPDLDGGANDMSLNQARKAYKEGKKIH